MLLNGTRSSTKQHSCKQLDDDDGHHDDHDDEDHDDGHDDEGDHDDGHDDEDRGERVLQQLQLGKER